MLSINDIQQVPTQNNFAYDDSIPFEFVANPPIINKGGLTLTPCISTVSALPPPTQFSCIIDWVGFVFNLDATYHPTAADKSISFDDFLADRHQTITSKQYPSIHTDLDKAQQFLIDLQDYVPLLTFHFSNHGRYGYKSMIDLFRDGILAGSFCFGGSNNKGTASLQLTGKGCSGVDMVSLRRYLQTFDDGHLTRVDVAHDDLDGYRSVDFYVDEFKKGNFFIKGAKPLPRNSGDWISVNDTKGRSFYVGNKKNGKEACFYEKGKQLGDPFSKWVRAEIRFTDNDHIVPFDILTSPAMYFSGSYPILNDTCIFNDRCEVIKKHAQIALDSLITHASLSYGKLINVMIDIGRTPEQIVSVLIRQGSPKRLEMPWLPAT